jgi:hypothetical protein
MAGDVSWMTAGSMLLNSTTAPHLPGTLVNNNGTVQLMGNSGLLGIPDVSTFNSWGYSFKKVAPANAADKAMSQNGVMATRVAGQLSPTALANTGCTSNCGTPVVNGSVSATLASDTPAAGTLVSAQTGPGQVGADLAHFNFTGSGTVTQVKINRIGVSSDTAINNVYLYQGNNRITDAGTFSQGVVTFSNSNGLFTVSGTSNISVKVDVGTNQSGVTVGAQLASFAIANGSPMSTSISGNLFQVASISNLATVQVQGTSNSALTGPGTTINAGLTNTVLWSAPISVGQRNVLLKYISFKQIGSISQSAIQNLRLMIDGSQVGSTASIMNSGSNTNVVMFDLSGAPVTLTTGGHTLAMNGDIVSGTSFTFAFSLQTATDAVFFDTNYGVNVPLTFSNNNSVFQLNPGTTTINSGTVSVQTDPSFTATQFVKSASQVTLGQWTLKAYGEDVKVQNLKAVLNYKQSNGTVVAPLTTEGFNNLTVTVNGGGVGSSQGALYQTTGSNFVSTGINTFTFGNTNLFTIPAGTTVTVAIKGDSTFTTGSNVASVRADLVTPQNSLQGVVSYSLTPSAGDVTYTGTSLTTSSSNANLVKNTSYSNQTISSNQTKQKIGSFTIQATNADGVRVTTLAVGLSGTFNQYVTNGLTNGLANLYIVTPAGNATPVQPSATSTFSTNFTVAANQSATVDVYADVSNATGTIITALGGSGVGSGSNQSVTFATPLGQTITVGNGTPNTPTKQTSSPSPQFVISGAQNQPNGVFNFVANSGGLTITEMYFYIATSSAATSIPVTAVNVGAVGSSPAQSGPVIFTSGLSGATSTVTGLNIAVPTSLGGIDVPVTVNLATVGTNGIATNQVYRLTLSGFKYVAGGSTTQTYVSVPANYMDLVGGAPTVAISTSGQTLSVGTVMVGKITVGANAAGGNIKLQNLPLKFVSSGTASTSDTSTTAVIVYDETTGQTVSTSNISFYLAAGASTTTTVTLNDNNTITPGTPHVYDISVTDTGPVGSAGTSAISMQLGAANLLTFTDVNGGLVSIPVNDTISTFIVGYPTTQVTVKN